MRWAAHIALMGREEVLVGKLREGVHLEDPDVDGSIVLKWILKKWDGCMCWIEVAQDRDRLWALVNAE